MLGRWYQIVSFGLVLTSASPSWSSATGTYISRSDNAVVMLQLVQTPDDHVTGQLSMVTIDTNGKTTDGSASVTGVVDGQMITLQMQPNTILSTPTSYSGKVDGAHIELTGTVQGGTLGTFTLQHGEVSSFQTWSIQLRDRSRRIIEARAAEERTVKAEAARQKLVASVDGVINRMVAFSNSVATNIDRYPQAEARYRAITAKMQSYLDRERRLVGDQRAALTRSQLAVTISGGDVATDQAHVEFEAFNAPLIQGNRSIHAELEQVERECHGLAAPALTVPASEGQPTVGVACARLAEAAKPYRASVEQIRKAHNQAEATYTTEHQRQFAILSEANRLSP